MAIESRNRRKEGLPKRDPSWETGGFASMVASMLFNIERSLEIVVSDERWETEEIFVSEADSEMEKTNERIKV